MKKTVTKLVLKRDTLRLLATSSLKVIVTAAETPNTADFEDGLCYPRVQLLTDR